MMQLLIKTVKFHNNFDALQPKIQGKIFVGGVDSVGFQAEAHQDAFDSEHFFESGNDRYAASAPYGQRTFAKHLMIGSFSRFIGRQSKEQT